MRHSPLLALMGGGENHGGLVTQNMALWGSPYIIATIAQADLTVFPNHALGKTFYRVVDDDAVNNWEALAEPDEHVLKAGGRYRAEILIDLASSLSSGDELLVLYLSNAAYTSYATTRINKTTGATALSQAGNLTVAAHGSENLSGGVWRMWMEVTVSADTTVKFQTFPSDEAGVTATGTAYLAEPSLRRIN